MTYQEQYKCINFCSCIIDEESMAPCFLIIFDNGEEFKYKSTHEELLVINPDEIIYNAVLNYKIKQRKIKIEKIKKWNLK
jgi:hypothetical protein